MAYGRTGEAPTAGFAQPPRWAIWCAWIVPLTILPSAIWRISFLFQAPDPWQKLEDGGWYLMLLSLLSMGLGLLTVGLVRPWGRTFPRWIPGIGGKPVNTGLAATIAQIGGWVVILLSAYGIWGTVLGPPLHFEPLVGMNEVRYPQPTLANELKWYLPMVAWGPLVVLVARNYRQRTSRCGTHNVSASPAAR